jgi:hypothetical protein
MGAPLQQQPATHTPALPDLLQFTKFFHLVPAQGAPHSLMISLGKYSAEGDACEMQLRSNPLPIVLLWVRVLRDSSRCKCMMYHKWLCSCSSTCRSALVGTHLVHAGLRQALADSLLPSGVSGCSWEELLVRAEGAGGATGTGDGGGSDGLGGGAGAAHASCVTLLRRPRVFTLALVWESPQVCALLRAVRVT